jgi:hypothetical protein
MNKKNGEVHLRIPAKIFQILEAERKEFGLQRTRFINNILLEYVKTKAKGEK